MDINELDFKIVSAYLVDRKGHRWIEAHLLNESGENLGFKARERLLKFNLDKRFKNLLADIKSEKELEELLLAKRNLITESKLSHEDLRLVWSKNQTIYLFQRVIRNNDGWKRPSAGRLGFERDGEYLKDNGFGHEDWNFNKDLSIDGHVYGYLYGSPAESKTHKKFNIVFCERLSKGGWAIVGYYLNATFEPNGSPESTKVIEQKIADLQWLRKMRSIGRQWDIDGDKMKLQLRKELLALRWKVKSENIYPFLTPVEIPNNLDLPKNERITTHSGISEHLFESLVELKKEAMSEEEDDEFFPEGRVKWIQHQIRERDRDVVLKAKENFLSKNGRFFCEACGFDFEKKYGDIGASFIEAHHTIPVSEYDNEGGKTSVKDIILLCSNCHKMIHRKRPWLKIDTLKELIKN